MKTKAVRIHGKMDLRLEEINLPEVGPDDVQVRVISDSICMSSYKAAVEGGDHKRVPADCAEKPTIIGREFCGDIVAVGENSLFSPLISITEVSSHPVILISIAVEICNMQIFLLKRS